MRCQKRVMQHPETQWAHGGLGLAATVEEMVRTRSVRGVETVKDCGWQHFAGTSYSILSEGNLGLGLETRRACVSVCVSWSVVYGAHCEHNGCSGVVFYVNLICMCIWANRLPSRHAAESPFACRIAAQ